MILAINTACEYDDTNVDNMPITHVQYVDFLLKTFGLGRQMYPNWTEFNLMKNEWIWCFRTQVWDEIQRKTTYACTNNRSVTLGITIVFVIIIIRIIIIIIINAL